MLIAAETLARTEVVNNNAALANQINPNNAGGVFLDAILALTGMQRSSATQTLVTNVTLTGVAGTVISAGTLAATAAGTNSRHSRPSHWVGAGPRRSTSPQWLTGLFLAWAVP